MKISKTFAAAVSAAFLGLCAGCSNDGASAAANDASATAQKIPLTIQSQNGAHVFNVELAQTFGEQERGLMYRRNLGDDFGMLFWPYPAGGGAPREASFWMKNTPSPLDIIFIRADGTIARIAENAVPFDTTPIDSGEPVGAVLEIRGGRSSELGIAEGDKVSWNRDEK